MPRRKEDTPSRIVKRNYEEKHRDERKQKLYRSERALTANTAKK